MSKSYSRYTRPDLPLFTAACVNSLYTRRAIEAVVHADDPALRLRWERERRERIALSREFSVGQRVRVGRKTGVVVSVEVDGNLCVRFGARPATPYHPTALTPL